MLLIPLGVFRRKAHSNWYQEYWQNKKFEKREALKAKWLSGLYYFLLAGIGLEIFRRSLFAVLS